MLTFFNLYYLGAFVIVETVLSIFKGMSLPYPISYVSCDLVILLLSAILDYIRLDLGRKGNLMEQQLPILGCLCLTLPCVLSAVYFIMWQTYVLRFELILSSIHFVFHGIEIVYCIVLTIGFSKKSELT